MNKRTTILLVGGSVAVVGATLAVRYLVRNPGIYQALLEKLGVSTRHSRQEWVVDLNSEHSFPASDPPSFSPSIAR